MNKIFRVFPILCLLFFTLVSRAQSGMEKKDTVISINGFKAWLTHSWLNSYLQYDTIENEYGKTFLTLRLKCTNDCTLKWEGMKASFDSLTSLSFEEYLWRKAIFHLEIPQTTFVIEIYNATNQYESPCFLRNISFSDSLIVKKINCKDLIGKATLNYDKFNPVFLMKKASIPTIDKKTTQILDTLYSKCDKYFKSKGSHVQVVKNRSETHFLEFQVNNLRNEVIKKSYFGGTIEKIQFTIICNFHSDFVSFETIVNGKYGSNNLKPVSDKGYNDMEDDYKAEFQTYVNDFISNKLLQWLK